MVAPARPGGGVGGPAPRAPVGGGRRASVPARIGGSGGHACEGSHTTGGTTIDTRKPRKRLRCDHQRDAGSSPAVPASRGLGCRCELVPETR